MSIAQANYLSAAQKDFFIENGFLKLPQMIPCGFLNQLREAVDELTSLGNLHPDNAVVQLGERQFVIAIDKIVAQSNTIFAELLGSPFLLSIAESLCGADFFPVQDFAVIKTLGDQNEVKWHQDVVTQAHSKTFMIGFYLDSAIDENGALRIIPNSHTTNLSICELQAKVYQSIDMEAGDVLIHNLKLAHSSGELTSFAQRRVVYFEFMSANEVLAEEVYPESFVTMRTSLIPNAIRCFQNKYPEAVSFEWKHPQKEQLVAQSEPFAAIQEMYNSPKKVKAANYCFDVYHNKMM